VDAVARIVDGEEYLTGDEAARLLGVKPATLYAYVSRGVLRSYREGTKRQRLYRRAELEALRVEGSAGGGLVRIELTGEKEIVSVKIDPSVVDREDVETLQDLVLAAFRDAARQVDEAVQKKTSAMLGGMLPGMR